MRKRIAVFANGWSFEYVQQIVEGICRAAKEEDTDVYSFISYSSIGDSEQENMGEFNTFMLPNLKDFDGVILMANSFNMKQEADYLQQQVYESGVPALSMEYALDDIDYIGAENYSGMYELTKHMIHDHGARQIVFIGGPADHAESNIRFRAVKDAVSEAGLKLDPKGVTHGDWSERAGRRGVKNWLEEKGSLPDVFMCANDIMAIGACNWLKENGYRIPEDVAVTGYDCIQPSREYEPVITSVNRGWDNMGYNGFMLLMKKMRGEAVDSRTIIHTRVAYGESCGCKLSSEQMEEILIGQRNTNRQKIDYMASDIHLRSLYAEMRKSNTADELYRNLSWFYETREELVLEGNCFMHCLKPEFFQIENDDSNLGSEFGPEMEVISYLKDGVARPWFRMKSRDLLFKLAEESDTPEHYILVALRNGDKCYGFSVLKRNINIVRDYMLYIWTRHMNQYLDQARQNFRLEKLTAKLRELSVTDVLTGVYNRMGCEQVAYPFLEECQKRGDRGIIMMVDIDRMKTINDKYGHNMGDSALRIVAKALKASVPDGWFVARYGGDEFLVAGKSEDEQMIDEVISKFQNYLKAETAKLPFPLTASIGGIQLQKDEEFQLEKSLQKADEYMYAAKRKRHAQLDGIL